MRGTLGKQSGCWTSLNPLSWIAAIEDLQIPSLQSSVILKQKCHKRLKNVRVINGSLIFMHLNICKKASHSARSFLFSSVHHPVCASSGTTISALVLPIVNVGLWHFWHLLDKLICKLSAG